MIRINLLPIRKVKRAEASQRQFLYMGVAVVATVCGVVFVHLQSAGQLEDNKRRNTILQADVARMKQEIGDYDKVRAQREELLRQRKTIQALDAGRNGPVYLLREMSELLSPGKGPTFDRVSYEETLRRDPNAGFNASWDPRRVWMESYAEDQKHIKDPRRGKVERRRGRIPQTPQLFGLLQRCEPGCDHPGVGAWNQVREFRSLSQRDLLT